MSEDLVGRFPEINYSNYDHSDVHALQNWAFEAIDELAKQAEHLAECIRSHQKVNAEVEELEAKLDNQSERVRELEAYKESHENLLSILLDSLEIIESHFDDSGRLCGDGKWRGKSIREALQRANEAVEKCGKGTDQ